MDTPSRPSSRLARPSTGSLLLWFLGILAATMGLQAGTTRTQVLNLQAGWNAVYIEVQPTNPAPASLFAGSAVQSVAWFRRAGIDAQYIRDPGDAPWRAEGWSVWHAASQVESVLSDLHEIRAGHAYLIRTSAAGTVSITGEARFTRLEWQPNNCTFTGLPVDESQGPTFQQFFAGSPAHARLRIYRLENGYWRLVRDPATTRAKAGEAYWIQTDGASRFQGPLQITLPQAGEIDFGLVADSFPIEINRITPPNTSPNILTLTQEGGTGALRLLEATQPAGSAIYVKTALASPRVIGTTPAALTLRIEPDRVAMTGPTASTLLKLKDPAGVTLWIPVRASR